MVQVHDRMKPPFEIRLLQYITDRIFKRKNASNSTFGCSPLHHSHLKHEWMDLSIDGFQKDSFLGNQMEDHGQH